MTARPTPSANVERYPSEWVPKGPTFQTWPSFLPSNAAIHSASPPRDRMRPTNPSTPPPPTAAGIGGPATVSHRNVAGTAIAIVDDISAMVGTSELVDRPRIETNATTPTTISENMPLK